MRGDPATASARGQARGVRPPFIVGNGYAIRANVEMRARHDGTYAAPGARRASSDTAGSRPDRKESSISPQKGLALSAEESVAVVARPIEPRRET